MRKKSQDLTNANNNSNQTDDNQHNTNQSNFNILSQKIMDITKVILNQSNSTLSATMAVAVAAAAAATASNNNNTSTSQQQQQQQQQQMNDNIAHLQQSQTKSKSKPMPLVIPSDISAFQQQNQYQKQAMGGQRTGSNIPYFHQQSMGSQQVYSHLYPNATLLKSPRLFNLENSNKKQYTPPPMLSPFRKGHGLFYNQKGLANLFSIPPLPPPHMGPNGMLKSTQIPYNHSVSCAYYYPSTGPSMLNSSLSYYPFGNSFPKPIPNNHYNDHQHQQQQHVCDQLDRQETNEYDENEQQSMTSRKRMKLADDGTYAKRAMSCTEKENVETTLPALDKQNDHDEQKETKKIVNDNLVENKQLELNDEDNCAEKENQDLKEESERIIADSLPPNDDVQSDEYNKKLLNQNGTFFPDEEGELSNEVIAAAVIECAEINKKPYAYLISIYSFK